MAAAFLFFARNPFSYGLNYFDFHLYLNGNRYSIFAMFFSGRCLTAGYGFLKRDVY
jgi:hypothetical protein